MRRAGSIFLIAVLLALPLAMLTDGDPGSMACNGFCCLPHSGHAMHMDQQASQMGGEKPGEGMSCHHAAAGILFNCGMKSDSRGSHYALFAPLPPAHLSAATALLQPVASRRAPLAFSQVASSGYLSPRFEPPRA
jgi:hypothetical protein